jgi:hypothetical protein
MKIKFKWFDIWIGAFYDRKKRILYICPIPMIVISIPLEPGTKEYIPKNILSHLPPNYILGYFKETCQNCAACHVVMCQRKNFCKRYETMVDRVHGHCDTFETNK